MKNFVLSFFILSSLTACAPEDLAQQQPTDNQNSPSKTEKPFSEVNAQKKAEEYIKADTYYQQQKGYDLTLVNTEILKCPNCFLFTYEYTTTDQAKPEQKYVTTATVHIDNGKINQMETDKKPIESDKNTKDDPPIGLANPASVHCEKNNGQSVTREDEEGNQTGYCVFEDGSECVEWAFFRGECEPGGQNNAAKPCPMDAKLCPDGSSVGRTGENCEFRPCPEEEKSSDNTVMCPMDMKTCPDGSLVNRDSSQNCAFRPCPGETQNSKNNRNYTVEKVLDQTCQKDEDCQTPPEYLAMSRCPFVSKCLEEQCTVVCPDFPPLPNRKPCTREYRPVCGEVQVHCIKAPCPPIIQTFPNHCEAENANALNIKPGKCENEGPKTISSFQACLEAGHPVMESHPRQCQANGKTFTEVLPPIEDKTDSTGGFCENLCGNGTCEEIVCMAEGCPCAETTASCPEDCE